MSKITLSFATALIFLSSFAANAVLNMGGKTVFTGTVIEIFEPGPATQIQVMITNITDASASKPYLIHLGPGVYDLVDTNIVMKEWVSIQGSGQDATKITAAVISVSFDASSAVLVGASNTALTDLSIENTGGGTYSMAIFNQANGLQIERVTATASGGSGGNYGIANLSSSPTIIDVTAVASGGTSSTGVYNTSSSSPIMTNVTATGSGGTNGYGVFNTNSSSPTMTNVSASGSGVSKDYGVWNSSSSPTMMNVTATAMGGSLFSNGVHISNSSSPFIQNSVLEGSKKGLYIDVNSTGTRVVNSKITGGYTDNATGTQCLGNYDAALADVGPC